MTLPNFFIAGAPKAGTDLLYYQLDQHPQIYMSPLKEPNYFAEEVRLHNFHPSLRALAEPGMASLRKYLDAEVLHKKFGGIITELSDYKRLFAEAHSEVAIGEGSFIYRGNNTKGPDHSGVNGPGRTRVSPVPQELIGRNGKPLIFRTSGTR